MITEHDLREAIAECQGVRNPNAQTCIKLAAFLTIQRELFGGGEPLPEQPTDQPSERGYSFAAPATEPEPLIYYNSGTDFSRAINGRYADDVWPVMDELLTVLQATNPRLFDGVMRKIDQI